MNSWGRLKTGSEIQTWLRLLTDEDVYGKEPSPDPRDPASSSLVYFIRGAEALKIGTTADIRNRFEQIQAHSPVRLDIVGLIYGGEKVERWCQYQCFDHRKHYEWFGWNGWTEAFVRWVLAHGDDAAQRLCPEQVESDSRCEVPRLPSMKHQERGAVRRGYRRAVERVASPLGACACNLCASKPWESWR